MSSNFRTGIPSPDGLEAAQRSICPSVMLPLHLTDRFPSTSRMRRIAVAVAAWLVAALGHGHPEIEAALSRLNSQIAAAPADAELYLARGEVYAKHHEWISAEANYLRAAEL